MFKNTWLCVAPLSLGVRLHTWTRSLSSSHLLPWLILFVFIFCRCGAFPHIAVVYNIKSQETRLLTLIPSDSWGGAGLLGVTIRLDNYGGADERLIRVLTVEHNSPAAIAGLVPEQDYLLGTVSESLDDTQSLANLLLAHVDQVVEFYVYNTNSDVVRVVPLMPTWSWGGKGLLGAEVGTGYLHRLPHAARSTSGSSMARKVRYVPEKRDETGDTKRSGNLEHAPQLELESEEGGCVTLASPEDVSDMSRKSVPISGANGAASLFVEATTEQEALEGAAHNLDGRLSAAELFASPPPVSHSNVDLR